MVFVTSHRVLGVAAIFAAILASSAQAAVIVVPPGGGGLQSIIAGVQPGDVVRLQAGEHRGPVTLDETLTLEGDPGAVVAGNGIGSVITINAPNTVIRGLEIRGSGTDVGGLDAGVFIAATARGARVEGNTILGNLYGIQLHGAENAVALATALSASAPGGSMNPATAFRYGMRRARASSTMTSASGGTASSSTPATTMCFAATASPTSASPYTTCTPTTAR